jgi:glycosyltransferase involved in cell wall biosynthesis
LSFNCPVICSDIPVFRELFEGYVSFFNVNSKEDLKQKIRSGLEEKEQVKTNTKELLRKYNYAAGARLILDSINQY